MLDDRTDIARRMEAIGLASGQDINPDLPPDPWAPRWTITEKWVEFECGCRAERCMKLNNAQAFDPVIFRDLPQQAVYDHVCHRHTPGMNKYVAFGRQGATFTEWHRRRRNLLMGKVF